MIFKVRGLESHHSILINSCHQIQYLKDIGGGITDINQNVSEVIEQLSALNTSVNQIMEQQKANGGKPNDVFQSESLPYGDFEEGVPVSPKVRKYKRKSLNDFVALKLVTNKNNNHYIENNLNNLKNQVVILKKLESCYCIIKFLV